jgi:hypothetical protein
MVRIYAGKIKITGRVISNDRMAGDGAAGTTGFPYAGAGGTGGSYSTYQSGAGGAGGSPRDGHLGGWGGKGGAGGRGAGGGILIFFDRHFSQIAPAPRVIVNGTLDNSGGLGVVNGGTIKVFTSDKPIIKTVTAGRVLRPDAVDSNGLKSHAPPFGAFAG